MPDPAAALRDILCVRTTDLTEVFPPPRGFHCGTDQVLTPLQDRGAFAFWPRTADLEGDPAWVQVVAYVLVRSQGLWAVFRRTTAAGEGRLAGRITLGLGGHVEQRDSQGGLVQAAVLRAAFRELQEEVDLGRPPVGFRRLGLIYDESDPVGARHLGVVSVAEFEQAAIDVIDPGLEHLAWCSRDFLRAHGLAGSPQVESWTRLLLEELILRPVVSL